MEVLDVVASVHLGLFRQLFRSRRKDLGQVLGFSLGTAVKLKLLDRIAHGNSTLCRKRSGLNTADNVGGRVHETSSGQFKSCWRERALATAHYEILRNLPIQLDLRLICFFQCQRRGFSVERGDDQGQSQGVLDRLAIQFHQLVSLDDSS